MYAFMALSLELENLSDLKLLKLAGPHSCLMMDIHDTYNLE